MQDDEHTFAFIDASIRRECAQKASQEDPWAGGAAGIGLVKQNEFNFLAGSTQKRVTRTSLDRDNGGHSGGSLPSPMDAKNATGSDAQLTPQLMGMSPTAEELADSAWLNESVNLDEIDIEELANGTTVLELVDLPQDESAAEQPEATAEAQPEEEADVSSDKNITVSEAVPDCPQSPQAGDIVQVQVPPKPVSAPRPGLGQAASGTSEPEQTPEGELLEQLQLLAMQPTKEEELQERLHALRAEQPTEPVASTRHIDERFAQVQRLVEGGGAVDLAGPSTSHVATSGAAASTSTGLGAQMGDLQARILGESTGAGSHEDQVKELLAQLKDTLASAPAVELGDKAEADESSAETSSDDDQVQALVERAALGDFDEVPPASAHPSSDSLDKQLRQQWRRDWEEQEDRQGQAHLSSELSCELEKVDAVAAGITHQPSPSEAGPAVLASAAEFEWSAQEAQWQDVKEATELLDKLQHCDKQPAGHERLPLWRAAIALRAATKGLEALQSGHLKLATFLNHIAEQASEGASLQPGDLLQVENFRLQFFKTSALVKAQSVANRASATKAPTPPDDHSTETEFPSVPMHKPEP